MIEVEGLTKYYGRLPAIQDVNFRVESGEIVGFLGPNGAGKTTTMRIITTFSPASAGDVRILGMDVRAESLKIRRKIGYVPENVPVYSWMRVRSYLEFVARLKGIPRGERDREIGRVAESAGVDNVLTKIVGVLSKGYRQRVGLAQALIGDPPILILDEPTIGLDPRQIREIRDLIKGFSRNRTVILSTHILPEVSQTCDRVIIINKGAIVAEDTPANLARRHTKASRAEVLARAPEKEIRELFSSLTGVLSVDARELNHEGLVKVIVDSQPDEEIRPSLSRAVVEKGWELLELKALDASLEDVFIELVTEESGQETSKTGEDAREVA